MARVRRALGRSPSDPTSPAPVPAVDEALVRLVHRPQTDDDRLRLVERFAAQARAAGVTVHRTHRAGLSEVLVMIVRNASIGTAAISVADPVLEQIVRASLTSAGGQAVAWDGESRLEPLFAVQAGFTDVVGAVAETGSIVCGSGPRSTRGAFLVPPVHVAIVGARQVVPDLLDAFEAMADGRWPNLGSATVIVSGPSKTADIEGVLVTGVHGPGQLHMVLVSDD